MYNYSTPILNAEGNDPDYIMQSIEVKKNQHPPERKMNKTGVIPKFRARRLSSHEKNL